MRGIYTYKITLSNTTSTATPPNLQVRLNINFASLISNINADLGNIRFSSDPAGFNLLYAWLESAPQGTFTQGSSVSSYISSNVWVNLGNNTIPANGSLNIYMQVLSSSTEFDGVYWGANPLWTSTYGQYDNGANVFNFYDNFAGTTLSSKWVEGTNGGTATINNGLTLIVPETIGDYVYVASASAIASVNTILEAYMNYNNMNVSGYREGFGFVSSQTYLLPSSESQNHISWQGSESATTESVFSVQTGSSYVLPIGVNPVDGNYHIWGLEWLSGEAGAWYNGYSPVTTTTSDVPTNVNYVTLSYCALGSLLGVPENLQFHWVRLRTYPPNGIDPVLISIILLVGNYVSASTPVPEWTTLSGKPYITVSAKGISNGLSNIPNDGADFGPDTPGTQTSGIQEAWNYAIATASGNFPNQSNIKPGYYWMKPILLLEGIFELQQKVFISPDKPIANIKMLGQGTMSTYVYWNFNDNAIEIDHTNGNIAGEEIEIGGIQAQPGSAVTSSYAFFACLYVSGDPSYQAGVDIYAHELDLASGSALLLNLSGFTYGLFFDVQGYGGAYMVQIQNSGDISIYGAYSASSYYINGAGNVFIIGTFGGQSLAFGNINRGIYVDNFESYSPIILLSNIPFISLNHVDSGYGYPFIVSSGSTPYTVDYLNINSIYLYNTASYPSFPFTGSGTGYTTANVNNLRVGNFSADTSAGYLSGVWAFQPSTPAMPSSGTAQANTNPYPVNVSIYGGTVTEIQITRSLASYSPTTYTVFTASSGIALSGQTYKLYPGDKITLTYSSAPSWVWIPEND
ncbi:MAG: hypothetical protein QXU98_06285 [Candidatus Parvarchaeota archaeon]